MSTVADDEGLIVGTPAAAASASPPPADGKPSLAEQLRLLDERLAQLKAEVKAAEEQRTAIIAQIASQTNITKHDVLPTCVLNAESCHAAIAFFQAAEADVKRELLEEVARSAACKLMADHHGYQLAQKMLEAMTQEQLALVVAQLESDDYLPAAAALKAATTGAVAKSTMFSELGCTPHGCTALQTLCDVAGADVARSIVALVARDVVTLSKDLSGRHVVLRVLNSKIAADRTPVVTALTRLCTEIGNSRHGCCILQRCLETTSDTQSATLITALLDNVLTFVQDAFGNYLVQNLLDLNNEGVTKRVIQQLLHNIAVLACNKFASNVVEKCCRLASADVRQLFIDELTDPLMLSRLVQDSYANYVIQTAIVVSSDDQFYQLLNAIRPLLPTIRHSPYGAKIETRFSRRLRDMQRHTKRHKSQQQAATQQPSQDQSAAAAAASVQAAPQQPPSQRPQTQQQPSSAIRVALPPSMSAYDQQALLGHAAAMQQQQSLAVGGGMTPYTHAAMPSVLAPRGPTTYGHPQPFPYAAGGAPGQQQQRFPPQHQQQLYGAQQQQHQVYGHQQPQHHGVQQTFARGPQQPAGAGGSTVGAPGPSGGGSPQQHQVYSHPFLAAHGGYPVSTSS